LTDGSRGELDTLRDNPLAARLAKLRVMSQEGQGGSPYCSACSGEGTGEFKKAEMLCVDCGDKLCDGCAKVISAIYKSVICNADKKKYKIACLKCFPFQFHDYVELR